MPWARKASSAGQRYVLTPARAEQAPTAERRVALRIFLIRGCDPVLVGVAREDAAQERLLQAVLLPNERRHGSRFQAERLLGFFGTRKSLTHRRGLMTNGWPMISIPCGACVMPSHTARNVLPCPSPPMQESWQMSLKINIPSLSRLRSSRVSRTRQQSRSGLESRLTRQHHSYRGQGRRS
jgi:hypothetical protein